MTKGIASLIECEASKALETHAAKNRHLHIRDLFDQDPKRGKRLKREAAGIYFNYSKNGITDDTVKLLLQLAEESSLRQRFAVRITMSVDMGPDLEVSSHPIYAIKTYTTALPGMRMRIIL